MRFQGFIGPSYTLRSKNVDCQRCINLYPELNEMGRGKEQEVMTLISTPGLSLLLTIGAGPIRGLYTASTEELFAVSGTKFYRISSAWVATELGTLGSASGPVSIADNGNHVVIVDGSATLYVWNMDTSAFSTKTSADDYLGANQVTFQDGYFVFNKPDSGQFYISVLHVPGVTLDVTFDGADISSSEGSPDNIKGLISDHRDLWLFNDKTTEVFFNSGNADFPFERIQGAFIEHGCAARFSVAKMNNAVFWLGQDDKGLGIVYMAKSYDPQRISTHAVENAIRQYENISDAVAYTYQEEGHTFYALNFPTANTTWVFDSSTSLWHERVYTVDGQFQRHRAENHALAFETHVVGDYENGKIYELSSSVYSDNGQAISRQRIAPHVSAGMKRVFYNSFQLDIETGVGLDGTTQGTDPQAMMDFSDDGGHSWSNEKWVSFGKLGNRHKRARWTRLGASRDRVFRLTITDPVKVTMLGAELEIEAGAS
jgi:hypothetical protein